MWTTRVSRLPVLVLVALPMFSGCGQTRPACYGETCPQGTECLANRCVVPERSPVPSDSERRVLAPVSIALISDHDDDAVLPPTVVFGGAAAGDVILYLRFSDDWKQRGTIRSAFLLLEPASGTTPDPNDIAVDAWVIREAWDAERLSHRRRPELGPPHRAGLARGSPKATLRLDVTELARHLSGRKRDHGLALTAQGSDGHGAAFLTGVSGGPPPRLELYLESRPR